MFGKRVDSPYLNVAIKGLEGWDYEVTSDDTGRYNCIAWAAGDESTWWEPFGDESAYWPDGAPQEYTLAAFVRAFELLRYVRCADDALEDGYEKVALYVDAQERIHAARQIDGLYWTSKLGRLHDIKHPLRALEEEYGAATVFLRRARDTVEPAVEGSAPRE